MANHDPVKVFCRHCHAKLDVTDLEPFSHVPCPECGTRLRVPKRFDRYLLEKICGIGGMSKVYRALEPELARRVAVKILNEECCKDHNVEKHFLEEARQVAQLNHPGVIPIYNCGVIEEQAFLAMRYMENGSVEDLLHQEGMIPVPMVASWICNIAMGLEYALREKNIVHHDIKPGNILLTAEAEAKLGDFDLADVRETGDALTQCDGWASPGYVSPERLLYGGEDFRGDIFSLGVTLYEMLTKKMPFGVRGTPEELLERRSNPRFPTVQSLNPMVSESLSQLVERMLAYQPDDRPQYPEVIKILKGEDTTNEEASLADTDSSPGWWVRFFGGIFRRKHNEYR